MICKSRFSVPPPGYLIVDRVPHEFQMSGKEYCTYAVQLTMTRTLEFSGILFSMRLTGLDESIVCSQSAQFKVVFKSRIYYLEGVGRYVSSKINNDTKDMYAFNSNSRNLDNLLLRCLESRETNTGE